MKISNLCLIPTLLINSYFFSATGATQKPSESASAADRLASLLENSPVSEFVPAGKQVSELTPAQQANLKRMLDEREELLNQIDLAAKRLSSALSQTE
jgi:hypothetical protein